MKLSRLTSDPHPSPLPEGEGAAQRRGHMTQLARWREITWMLVLRDLQARSRQAYLGYFWILAQPLLMTGAFTFLVQRVLGRGDDTGGVPYPVFLLAALVPWQFFANSLIDSTESLVRNVDLVRQVYFPREILAIYPIFARLVDVLVGCAALAVFMFVARVPPSPWVMLTPIIVLELMLFVAAFGLLLSAANVGWRDISRGLPLLLFLLLYAVPVLYAADSVPAAIRPIYDLNPIAHLIEAFRAAVLGTHDPDVFGLGVLGILGVVTLLIAQRCFSVVDGVLADVI
jgi:lipopolysaccharide transport system permease protein